MGNPFHLRRALAVPLLLAPACHAPADSPAGDAPPPEAQPAVADAHALDVAHHTLDAMGGAAAWERVRFVSWDFFGARRHWWDRYGGDVRVESGGLVVLMNLHTRAGRAFEDGVELAGPQLEAALERGYAWWVNDSYWMFMPYKLLDPGVTLAWLGEGELADGRAADVLELTFDDVGLTPDNRYEVLVARDTGLVERWRYQADADSELADLGPWADWQPFGGILLATSHGRGRDWNIAVHQALPRSVFESPEPVD